MTNDSIFDIDECICRYALKENFDINNRLTPNILYGEICCKCNCGFGLLNAETFLRPVNMLEVNTENIARLAVNVQMFLDIINVSVGNGKQIYIYISSWCRCQNHNKAEGGAKDSYHIKGMALDLKIYFAGKQYLQPKYISRMALLLSKAGVLEFGGIGCYHNRVHLDIRENGIVTWYKVDGEDYIYNVDFTESLPFAN